MKRSLMVLLLSSTTVLGACATGPSGSGETVIQGPPEPVTRTVEVPVYVQVPEANPPKDRKPVKRDPLKVLAEVNQRSTRIPDPDDYIGATYSVPTIPGILYQVYMAEGQPTTIDLPPGQAYRAGSISNPSKWERADLGISANDNGESVQTLLIRPYEAGLRNQTLTIKTDKTQLIYKINTYRGIFHHAVVMQAPLKELDFPASDALPGVEPFGSEPAIPTDAADYGYSIGPSNERWRPSAVFTHGGKTYIELPIDAGKVLPPKVVDTSTGTDRPVNAYVSHKRYLIIPDQVLTRAELRWGDTAIKIQRTRE
jgi:type IV secretory pathway VirB9-like protein